MNIADLPGLSEGMRIAVGVAQVAAVPLFGVGCWWCKNMADEIKYLKNKTQKLEVVIEYLKTKGEDREKLQDERWGNQNKTLGDMQADIKLLLQCQIRSASSN